MTIAGDIINLALRNGGISGVGQAPTSADTADALIILNDMINQWQLQRTVMVIPTTLPTFPDLTTNVSFWTGKENVLLTTLAVRLRSAYMLPPDELMNSLATTALQLFQSNNRQFQPAVGAAANDGTGNGLVFLALRAAGRVNDQQNVLLASQDMTDGQMLLTEMLSEWQLQRSVMVIPGTFPVITNFTSAVTLTTGLASAIVLNLAVRMRDAFGLPDNKGQEERAAAALAFVQANNQQQVAPLHAGVPATAIQVIFLALRAAGRITDKQSVSDSSADVDAAFSLLVDMIAQWQRRRWLVPNEIDVSVVSTGAASYTIGPAGDFVTPRPDRIESAFARYLATSPNPIDFPLSIIQSREDYNKITLKSWASFPQAAFYDSAWPVGALYVWPLPSAGLYEIHISLKASLGVYSSTASALGLPPEYNEALITNLALRICALNGVNPTQGLADQARAARQGLRMANFQPSVLDMPLDLRGRRLGGLGMIGIGGSSTSILDLQALIAALPTVLPATAGMLWNNGGVVCLS